MPAGQTHTLVHILVGLFLGILIGIVGTLAFKGGGREESYEDYARRTQGAGAPSHGARPQPPDDAGHGGGHGGGDGQEASFAKVHFMRKFVAALTEPPANLMPAPDHRPLLAEGAEPIWCSDCHDPSRLNFEAMLENDPGDEAVQPFRMMRRGFMIPLMTKWVERLNKLHAGRLRKEVTCTDCHAMDPRDPGAQSGIPPLMIRFVRALKEPPQNENPAKTWKPLLRDPQAPSMLCSVCHGRIGAQMEQNLAQLDRPPPPELEGYRPFMVNLMERWVRELNRKMKDRLVKAVTCTDCHETDPRK